jgi:hypothetical protein
VLFIILHVLTGSYSPIHVVQSVLTPRRPNLLLQIFHVRLDLGDLRRPNDGVVRNSQTPQKTSVAQVESLPAMAAGRADCRQANKETKTRST